MPEGLTSIEDLKVVISAETESLGKGLENASAIISRFTGDADGKLKGFDGALARIGSGILSFKGALGVWAEAATVALDLLGKIGEKGDVAFKQLGAEEEWNKLKASVADLVPALQEGFVGALDSVAKAANGYVSGMNGMETATASAASSADNFSKVSLANLEEALKRVAHEARRLASTDTWSVTTADNEIARIKRQIEATSAVVDKITQNGSTSLLDKVIGAVSPWHRENLGTLDELQKRLAALQVTLGEMEALRTKKQWSVLEVDDTTPEYFKGLEREIDLLKLRAATLGMSAAEAAAHTASVRIRAEAEKDGEAALAAANAELAKRIPLMIALRQQIDNHAEAERQARRAEQDAARQEKGRESIVEGMDRELMSLRQKQRALTDNSAATKAQEIEERTLAQARQRNVEVTEEMAIKIKAYSAEIARADEALKGHQQMLNQLNQVGSVVFKGLETGLDQWMSGGKVKFKDLVDSMMRDLQRLLLRMMVIQPLQQSLFGGGGSAGALGSLFGGFRAEGGPVDAGRAYVVGERGPEMFIPRETGGIVSNDSLRRAAGGDGGEIRGNTTVNVINNHPGVRIETEETVDGRGNRSTQVMIEETVARSLASPSGQAAMRGYGNRPVLTQR